MYYIEYYIILNFDITEYNEADYAKKSNHSST